MGSFARIMCSYISLLETEEPAMNALETIAMVFLTGREVVGFNSRISLHSGCVYCTDIMTLDSIERSRNTA